MPQHKRKNYRGKQAGKKQSWRKGGPKEKRVINGL
jgi:hypothetical protein